MSDIHPVVSILIPVYNTGLLAMRAINSALAQTCDPPTFEVLVVDDGSTNGTSEMLAYLPDDPRLRVIRAEHAGAAEARNRLLAEARGEYVLWLDSDDTLSEYALAVMYNVMQRYYADACRVDSSGNRAGETEILTGDQYLRELIPDALKSYFCGMLMKRSLFDGLLFRPRCLIEDYELHPSIAERINLIAVMHRVDLYAYTQGRRGSLTTEYGRAKAGVHERCICYAERYERYHRTYPEECDALMGELADYLCAEYGLDYDSRNEHEMTDTRERMEKYEYEMLGNHCIPWYRQAEIRAILKRSRWYGFIHWLHKAKQAVFGVRKENRKGGEP